MPNNISKEKKFRLTLIISILLILVVIFINNQNRTNPDIKTPPTILENLQNVTVEQNKTTMSKLYKTDAYTVEIPGDWEMGEQNGIYFYKGLNPTQYRCGNISDASLSINITDQYRFEKKWSEVLSLTNFYDMNQKFWKQEMSMSGGGGILTVDYKVVSVGDKKAVKQTKKWSDVTECFDRIENNYFIPDKKYNDNFQVWIITTKQFIENPNYNKFELQLNQILSTLTFN